MNQEKGLSALEQCLEVLRSKSGINWSLFSYLHRGCDLKDPVVVGVLNSKEIDPASGDYKPLFEVKLICDAHNASSIVERIQGQ